MNPVTYFVVLISAAAFVAANTNVWTLLSGYPPGLTTKSGIKYNDQLYLFPEGNVNDWDAEQRTMNHLYVMTDITKHSWEFKKSSGPAPIVRDDYCSALVGHEVAVFGGLTDTFLADLSYLSLKTLSWTPYERDLRNSPKGRRFPYCFEWKNSLFVYGGLGPISSYNDLWQFNTTLREWSRIPATDAPFTYGGVSAVYNENLFIYSGRTTSNVPNTLWRMNLTNYAWTTVSINAPNNEPLTGAYRASSALVGSRLYVFFGLGSVESTTPLTAYFALDLDLDPNGSRVVFYGNTPSVVPTSYPYGQAYPLPRYGSSAVAIGSKIAVSGGIHNNVEDTVWVFNTANNDWSDISSNYYPISRRGAATATISSIEFTAFGGYAQPKSSQVLLNDLWTFNRETRRWTNLSPLTAYDQSTLEVRPPGLRRSSIAFFNGAIYIVGGYTDLPEIPDIFYSFNLTSKMWKRLQLEGIANGVTKSYGQAYSNIQSLFYLWGGSYRGDANITRQSITTINLSNLAVRNFSGSGSAPTTAYASNGFVFGGQTFCVQGGASIDYDQSSLATFDSIINCFRDSSNSWFAFASPPRTSPTLSYSSFAFIGSGIMTGGVNSFGDNTYETWIYDFIRKTWGKHADPLDRPGPFSRHSSVALGSHIVVSFADSGSTLDNRVYDYDVGTMFCSGNQEIIATGSSITVDDGSAAYTYMPNTNCSWSVQGANNLVVTQFSMDPSASLKMRVDSECGDRSIRISNRDPLNEEATLSGLALSTTVNVPSGNFRLFFESSGTYDTLGGFTFSGLNCPKGFRVQSSRCVCPLNHYITPSNECYPCESGTYQTVTNMRHCIISGSRVVASTNYFVNASIGDWSYVNETMPLCLSSSATTFKSVAYFFCSFNGASARESETVPLTVFTITQLYTSKWRYEFPASVLVPPSRKSACTLSTSSAIFYVSGRSPAATDKRVYRYDPSSRMWTRLAPSPIDVAGQACAISGDRIMVHGGETEQGEVISSMQIYSISNDSWTVESWSNSPVLSYHAAWIYGNRIFIYGGYDGIQEMNGIYSLNIVSEDKIWNGPSTLIADKCVDCFKDGRSCVLARQMMSASIVGNKVYLYGGYQRKSVFRELLVLDTAKEVPIIISYLPYDPEDYSLQSAPPATFQASSANMGSNLFIFGGYGSQSSSPLNFMWNLNTAEEIWFGSNQAYNPLPRRDFAATKILEFGFAIFGGYVKSFTEYLTNDAWIFNKRLSQWVKLTSHEVVPTKPSPRSRCGLAYHANFIYVFGGTDIVSERTMFWRLDVSRVILQNAVEVNVNWQALSLASGLGPNHNILLRSGFSYVTVDGTVWLWGGEINIDQEVAEDYRSSFALNIRNLRIDVHSPSGDNPIPRIGHVAVRFNSDYCIHGGEDFRKRKLSDVWCFSSFFRNWSRVDDGSVAGILRISHAATNLGNDILIHGGVDGAGSISSEAWLYQFSSSTWIKMELGSGTKRLAAVYSHFITSYDDQVVIYGGSTQRDSTSQLSTYRPGICNPSFSIPVSSTRAVQRFEDSSGKARYPSGTQCRWEFRDATHLLLNYTLGPRDRIVVSERTSSGSLEVVFTSSSSTLDSREWVAAKARGLVVSLASPESLISPAQGQFVKAAHIACPLNAKVDANSFCYCENGFYEDDISNECKSCANGSKDSACPQPDDSALDSGALGAVIGGTIGAFVLIGSIVYRRYASKMKAMADREQALFAKIGYDELEFGKLLGVGSFGEVFIGNWRGSQVAVKKLNYSKMNKSALREFESEVSVMVQLRHPNVVLYMGAVIEPPNLCILAELMTRGSLHDIIHNESIDLEYEQRLGFLIDAAKGLQYLHMCNPPMLHKDLKSPNLLLDDKWNLKISDFGLTGAKGTSVNDEPPGTLLWMAPEVIMAQPYVEGSDIYSYSIIMWEVFTRFEPYQGELAESVAIRVAQEGFRPALPASDIMPEEVQNIMIRCWDQDPTKRPPFKDVLRELNAINGTYSATQSNSSSTRKGTGTMSSAKGKEAPPTGKVALVFTDVQSSTSMWEKYPEEMSEALVMHNELMRGVIRRNGGYEVKTEGDAFMITFKSVRKAVSYCLQAQETLLAAVWPDKLLDHPAAAMETSKGTIIFRGIRVRMGVHYGEPLCREDPITGRMDYFGPVVNRAARVGGFPRGGQVALSEPAYMEIVSELESLGNPVIRDLGEHMLKGLNVPDHLYEILPLGLADRSLYFMGETGSGSSSSVPNFVDQSASPKTATRDNFAWQVDFEEIQMTDQELGSGSFGIVYLGEFRNEKVAVKKFSKQKVGEKQYFELLAEIMLLRELDHPKILKFVGACLKPPNICMVMEYAQYGSLRSVLNDHQVKMSGTEQRSVMMQIADGMKFLNGRNPPIYHRDLKSPNILVGDINPFIVKLADFGLARVKADNQTMTKCGTKGWLAPEVLKGLRYNEKADVYSFGIMAWEVITRQKPYHGMDPLKLNFEVVSGLRPPVPKSGDAVLIDLMKQCWAGDPETRPSFAQIYDLLDNSLTSKTEK